MEAGTVIKDGDDRMWLCVVGTEERDDDPVLGPINCLMMCADQRIDQPTRTLKNVPGPVRVVAVPHRSHCPECGTRVDVEKR